MNAADWLIVLSTDECRLSASLNKDLSLPSSPHHVRKSQDTRELEVTVATMKIEMDSLRSQLVERDDRLKVAETARDRLERDIASHLAEINVSLITFQCYYVCSMLQPLSL